MAKELEELYKERLKRVEDAIQLKVPDRVPVLPGIELFYAKYGGISYYEAFYDPEKLKAAIKKTIADFEPDMYFNPRHAFYTTGPLMDIYDYKVLKWPGHGVPHDRPIQSVEAEYMLPEDYDAFLEDPSNYILRSYIPRIYGKMEAFKTLPPLNSMMMLYGGMHVLAAFARPEILEAFETLKKAREESLRFRSTMDSLTEELTAMGFPSMASSGMLVPFDIIGNVFRGRKGIMMDMYRRPDKLIQLTEKICPMLIDIGILAAERARYPWVYIPVDCGSSDLMSLEQFKTFYWPTAKKMIDAFVDAGLYIWLFFESRYDDRLEILRNDLPKGKTMCHFEFTDIFKAKEMLRDVACIRGNVPISLLMTGTPEEVKEYCKKLIDGVGKDGGFIMDSGTLIHEAKPENVKAMIDFTKEYGVYR